MKETYAVKLPKRIVFGDPWYFERYSGEKLKSLTVDMMPPSRFVARVVLDERPNEIEPDLTFRSMAVYMAPEQIMQTYLQGMVYESQTQNIKDLGVDTAKYLLSVDGRSKTIHTGGDGYWGDYMELSRMVNGKPYLDAAILTFAVPEGETMESMRKWLNYFFENVQQVENAPDPDMSEDEIDDCQGFGIQQ